MNIRHCTEGSKELKKKLWTNDLNVNNKNNNQEIFGGSKKLLFQHLPVTVTKLYLSHYNCNQYCC